MRKKKSWYFDELLADLIASQQTCTLPRVEDFSEAVLHGISAHGVSACAKLLEKMRHVDNLQDYFMIAYNAYIAFDECSELIEKVSDSE